MGAVGFTSSMLFILSPLCVFLLLLLFVAIRFLNKLWWSPIRVQRFMRQQGIRGPPYKFFHGNTKEIFKMKKESISGPMGLSHNIFPRLQPHLCTWINLYGRNFLSWNGPQADFVVTEVEFIKEIFNNDQVYTKREIRGITKILLGNGLVASKGEKWAKQRKLANHTFHADRLKSMTAAMIASVEMMLEKWKQYEGKEMEVFAEFKFLTSDIISRTAFGSSYLEGKDIFDTLAKMAILITRNVDKVKFPGLLRSNDEIEAEKLERGIHDSIVRIMEKREKASGVNGEVGNYGSDFLGMLMKAKNDGDEKKRISVQDVVDECKTFYVTGQETMTILFTWALFFLGIHTDWQEKARQEVLNVFGNQKPNAQGISRLKTMGMIINETLRLYPPVLAFNRIVKGETKLGKYKLPADINIHVPILSLHHDKQVWGDDAQQFNPERFSQGVLKATNNNPCAFIPFGLGPRSCVGMNFGTTEAKIALAMILQRYSFTLSAAYIHSPFQILTVRPQHGVQIILQSI